MKHCFSLSKYIKHSGEWVYSGYIHQTAHFKPSLQRMCRKQNFTVIIVSIYPTRLILSAMIIWLQHISNENSSGNLVLIHALLVCIQVKQLFRVLSVKHVYQKASSFFSGMFCKKKRKGKTNWNKQELNISCEELGLILYHGKKHIYTK